MCSKIVAGHMQPADRVIDHCCTLSPERRTEGASARIVKLFGFSAINAVSAVHSPPHSLFVLPKFTVSVLCAWQTISIRTRSSNLSGSSYVCIASPCNAPWAVAVFITHKQWNQLNALQHQDTRISNHSITDGRLVKTQRANLSVSRASWEVHRLHSDNDVTWRGRETESYNWVVRIRFTAGHMNKKQHSLLWHHKVSLLRHHTKSAYCP
jgi:hypothetical protein